MALGEADRVYDELLLTLVQAGDSRAAARLAARWQPRLLRAAQRLLGNTDEAEDAVQETWAGIARGWLRISDPASFPAWAFGILRHKCADRIRVNRRDRGRSAALAAVLEDRAIPGDEERLTIARALDGLSTDHRLAAILYFGEGLSLDEVARATGVPAGTAKSRICHARRKLKAALTGDEHEQH